MYEYLTKISSILRSGINVDDFADSFSFTQYTSKLWLVETLKQHVPVVNPTILILGGWYGSYLVPMLREHISPSHIFFNDVNSKCISVAEKLHGKEKISYHDFDATLPYFHNGADVVINTSCEHMESYDQMLKEGPNTFYVLQSCDNQNDPGHINTSSSTQDFLAKLNFKTTVFTARKDLGHKNRFLVIGKT